jgi:LysM repeat protein/membrane protease YdiL (CAAX protease family)
VRRLAPGRWLNMATLASSSASVQAGRHRLAAPLPPPSATVQTRLRLPPLPIVFVFFYVTAVAAAELATTFTDARWGLAAHITILAALLAHASLAGKQSYQSLFLALSLAPLIRILSLTMPLENVDLVYWYAIVAVPLLLTAAIIAANLKLSLQDLGLTLRALPLQGLIAISGLGFGVAEYFILRPKPLIDELSWNSAALPALILLVGTGFNEEFVFRGVMQSASRQALGKLSILYVAVVFAVLHLGYKSVSDVAFVFAVGLLFGWLVARTRSLLGVTLAHGTTNITLYLVVPFLGIAAAATPAIGVQNMEELTHDISREVQHIQALRQDSEQALRPSSPPSTEAESAWRTGQVLIRAPTETPTPTMTPTATPSRTPTPPPPPPTEPEVPTQEIYIVQPGDSLADIAALYSTTVEDLLLLNDLLDPNLLYTGQPILVPAPVAPPAANVHVVEAGETLAAIAERYGTTVEELLSLNDLPDPNNVPVGQVLILPAAP